MHWCFGEHGDCFDARPMTQRYLRGLAILGGLSLGCGGDPPADSAGADESGTSAAADDDASASATQPADDDADASAGDDATGADTGNDDGDASSSGGDEPPPPVTCRSTPAPAWFVELDDGTWTTIAGGDGERIADRLPEPVPHADGGPDNPGSITAAWTGGAVDQARGEYLLVANGGHADYPGNEAYALALRDEAPAWRRIADPTPNDRFGDWLTEGDGTYADGRPRAMHSTFECFGDGRVWFPLQNSVTSGGGGTVNGVVSFDRDGLGDAATPLPWTDADLGPWERWGAPFPEGSYIGNMIFGVCTFDRVDHKVWALGGNSAGYTVYWSVDTIEATLGQIQTFQQNQAFGHWGGWVVVAHDLRLLVAGDHYRESITVLDLTKAGEPGDWQEITNVEGEGYYESGAGGVYSEASHAIGAGNPKTTGTAIHRLQIPTTDGAYDPDGTWTWSTLEPEGPDIVVSGGNSSAYTKWNVVEDMCNGQAALVTIGAIDGPVHAYKIPATGL